MNKSTKLSWSRPKSLKWYHSYADIQQNCEHQLLHFNCVCVCQSFSRIIIQMKWFWIEYFFDWLIIVHIEIRNQQRIFSIYSILCLSSGIMKCKTYNVFLIWPTFFFLLKWLPTLPFERKFRSLTILRFGLHNYFFEKKEGIFLCSIRNPACYTRHLMMMSAV